VFTQPKVVEWMLDLIGYTPDADLKRYRLLEPCFGGGDFFLIALDRLMESYFTHGGSGKNAEELGVCLCAVELHAESYQQVIHRVINRLQNLGISDKTANSLAHTWLRKGDFLRTELQNSFTHIVGNPPYIRLERIPAGLLGEYRKRYPTFSHRADLYVPFFERGLQLLTQSGKLAYICSDRWMKNRYGVPLRQLIAHNYHLHTYADMNGFRAFHSEVRAYPAITVIVRARGGSTRVILGTTEEHLADATPDGKPWLLGLGGKLAILRRLEATFPTLEQVGCKVGIGVATGADKVFVQPASLEVEEDRKLPILLAKDVRSGQIEWSGQVLLNPLNEQGQLVDLKQYPRLREFFEAHRAALSRRYLAKKHPQAWYRTIDPVHTELLHTPKLLLPDIAGEAVVALDKGGFYPHHNLYWITAGEWDLRALQTVLRSPIAKLFVEAYSVEMRGGYFRYQAQNLRRICLPAWSDVSESLAQRLEGGDPRAIHDLYCLTAKELELFTG